MRIESIDSAEALSLRGRLLRRTRREGACLVWTGHRHRKGYGRIRVGGVRQYVHRVAYALFIGPIPEGLTVDHLCRNRGCVEASHLEAVPNSVNVLRGDGVSAKKARQTHCQRGHPLPPSRACRYCKSAADHRRRSRVTNYIYRSIRRTLLDLLEGEAVKWAKPGEAQ